MLAVTGTATAQAIVQPTTSFSLPPGLRPEQTSYMVWAEANRHLILYLDPQAGQQQTAFQITVLDTTLRVRHQDTLMLRGLCELLPGSPTSATRHVLYQFRQRLAGGPDSTLNLVLDTAGTVVTKRSTPYHRIRPHEVRSLQQPTDNFVLREQGATRKTFFIGAVAPDLRLRWKREIISPQGAAGLTDHVADSSHLWLLVTENSRRRRNAAVAICLDLATGRELSRTPLLVPGTRGVREPSACNMAPVRANGAVVIAGHAFRGRRPKGSRMGDLFVTQLLPNGTRLADRQILEPREKTRWQHVSLLPNGDTRVVGESYSSTSLGANFAIGVLVRIATLGLLGISQTTLHPQDIVVATLDSSLAVRQWQRAELPDGGGITLAGYWPARRIAQRAARERIFRLRAYADNNSGLLLRTSERAAYVGFRDMQITTLRDQPEDRQHELMACYGKQAVVLEFDNTSGRFSLHRLRY